MVFISIFHFFKNVEKWFFQFSNFNILSSYSTHNITQKSRFLAVTILKCKSYANFYNFLLLLSGDESLKS